MATVNEVLLDQTVAHQIDLVYYSNGVVRRMIALLNRTDPDLYAQLTAALERLPSESYTVQRLESMLESVREVNAQAYARLSQELQTELRALTEYEAGYQQDLFRSVMPVQVSFASVDAAQVYAAAMARPFQGKLLSEVLENIEVSRAARIRDAIRIGYVEGQTIDQMVQRIRGTRALKYTDGLMQTDRRNVEAIVRTAINHTANFASDSFFAANASLIKALRWTSTIDGRTSEVCRARDGKLFPIDSGPRPPAHFNCRSKMTPVTKSFRELGLDIDELPASTRASMNGQIPADMTYQEWLSKRPADFQDEILGKTKGKLFRDGGLTLDRFVDRNGKSYTLDQLRARDSAAFSRAGL